MAVAFSPDGSALAVCGDGAITVFSTGTGLLLWTVELEQAREAGGVAYSPDGKTIVTGHGSALTFLDAATGNLQNAY
jgi:WD40 repeat protein